MKDFKVSTTPKKGLIEKYNLWWPKGTPILGIELYLFLAKLQGNIGNYHGDVWTYEHFINAAKILWPEEDRIAPDGRKIIVPVKFVWTEWHVKMIKNLCKYQVLAIAGGGGFGKCLGPNVPVLMYDGSVKPAKDIKEGDVLVGDDSSPRIVLGTNTGSSNMVRIVPIRGDSWECNDDHILTLKRAWAGEKSQRRVGEVVDISVKDYLATSQKFKEQHKLFCAPSNYPEQAVEFDPRVYGFWLGDGSKGMTHLTSPDSEKEVNEYFTSYFERMGYVVKKQYYGKSCPTWMVSTSRGNSENPFLDFVRESSFDSENNESSKRILKRYLYNSREVRMNLLAGLLDTDGYANAGSGFEISCSYKGLAKDIVFLARSLGFRVTYRWREATCNGKKFPACRIYITGATHTIPTLRKKCREGRTDSTCVSFQVEQLGHGEWAGFQVDGNGRFLLGDFTVTHNSEMTAIWLIINFLADPANTLGFATSTTVASSKKRIWGKVVRYWSAIEHMVDCGKLVDSAGMIRYVVNGEAIKGDLAGITLVPAEKKKEKDALEKLRGMHAKRIIFVADELGALSPSVPEAAFMNLKLSTEFFSFVGIDNPHSYVDAFGEIAEPIDGWKSITIDSDEWMTKRGKCLHFDLLKNPNVLLGQKKYPWMPSQEDIDAEIAVHGGKTASFYQMYRGFWPQGDVVDQIYTEVEIINAKGMEKAIWRDNELVHISFLDPSFTNGGDRTIAYFATVGYNIEGIKVLQFDEFLQFKEDVTDTKFTRPQQLAYWWMKMCQDRGVAPRYAGMDASGTGLTLASVIHTIWSKEIYSANFGSKASDKPVSAYDPTPSHERYVNTATEIWVSGKEFLRSDQIRGISREMMGEMCYRKLDRAGERSLNIRMKLVPKAEMKIQYGKSPDIAEAGLGCLLLARERLALDSSATIRATDTVNKKPASHVGFFKRNQNVYRTAV